MRRYGNGVKVCERIGHTIVGNETPREVLGFGGLSLGQALHMAEYETLTGEVASPEWYDGPDDI